MHILDEPVYLSSVVVGEMYDADSMQRALYGRLEILKGAGGGGRVFI